jgi:hypothetical protein
MEKAFVVKRVADQLWSTEAALDDALLQANDLMREITQARREFGVAGVFCDEVNVKLMEAMQAVTAARTAMVGVHAELKDAGLRLGLRTEMSSYQTITTGIEKSEIRMQKVG